MIEPKRKILPTFEFEEVINATKDIKDIQKDVTKILLEINKEYMIIEYTVDINRLYVKAVRK